MKKVVTGSARDVCLAITKEYLKAEYKATLSGTGEMLL